MSDIVWGLQKTSDAARIYPQNNQGMSRCKSTFLLGLPMRGG